MLAINCEQQFFDPAERIAAAKNISVLCGPRAPTGAEATPFRAEATGERSIYIYIYIYIYKYIIHSLRTIWLQQLKNRCLVVRPSGAILHDPSTLMVENAKYIFIVVIKNHIYLVFDFTFLQY